MRFVIIFCFLIALMHVVSAQNLADTTVIVDDDTFTVYRCPLSKFVKFKSKLSYAEYIFRSLSDSARIYVAEREISKNFIFILLIDIQGETHILRTFRGSDPYLENEFYKIFKKMTWEPALNSEGNPVNTMISIPIIFNETKYRRQTKRSNNKEKKYIR